MKVQGFLEICLDISGNYWYQELLMRGVLVKKDPDIADLIYENNLWCQ
jgi:hypothetical protein